MKLVICEKPSVAKSIASALGVTSRATAVLRGTGSLFPGAWAIWCPRWTRRGMTLATRNGGMMTFPFCRSPSVMCW